MDKALILGVTGMDGSTISRMLLKKGYFVIGLARRSSVNTTERIKDLLLDKNFKLVEGDITDCFSLQNVFNNFKPDEIYLLAAQSHVQTSFEQPAYTMNVNVIGTLNVLEVMRKICPKSRLYFAATSEMFGNNVDSDGFQRETTNMKPCSPYAISKLAGFNLIKNYRESYGLHTSSGILFNHESPLRGEMFVTRKITKYVAELKHYKNTIHSLYEDHFPKLKLGNINSYRDWGYAEEYCAAMFLMLQQEKPDDYVIATGETHSVEEFLKTVFVCAGIDYKKYIEISQDLIRPSELDYLKGDSSKAKKILGWEPKVKFHELAILMLKADYEKLEKSPIYKMEEGCLSQG